MLAWHVHAGASIGTELSNGICYLATPLAVLIFSNSMELETVDPLANLDVDDTADSDTNDFEDSPDLTVYVRFMLP